MNTADALASEPLYILSAAGQELFHTNFLYWLGAYHHEDAAVPVFNALGLQGMDNGQLSARRVEREIWNIDLFYDSGMGSWRLVLENKLAAIPDRTQLEDYHTKLVAAGHGPDDFTTYTLLSLLPPLDLPKPWRHVDHAELVEPLRQAAERVSGFDQSLIVEYQRLVIKLVALRDSLQELRASNRWGLNPAERTRLREARALPLAEKMLVTMRAQDIRQRLDQPDLFLEVGLSNTLGRVTYFHPADSSRDIRGWQMQGNQFRFFVKVTDKRLLGNDAREARERYVAEKHGTYFSSFPRTILQPAQSKEWLGYNPDFVYKYKVIPPDARWDDVVQLCCDAIHSG